MTESNANSPSETERAAGSMTKSNQESPQEKKKQEEKQGEKELQEEEKQAKQEHHPKTPPLNKPGSSLKKLIKLSHRCPGGG